MLTFEVQEKTHPELLEHARRASRVQMFCLPLLVIRFHPILYGTKKWNRSLYALVSAEE